MHDKLVECEVADRPEKKVAGELIPEDATNVTPHIFPSRYA